MSKAAAAVGALSGLRRWMEGRNLEAVYISRPVSIAYLTGFSANPHERLMGLAVRPDRATLIVPAVEQQKASERTADIEVVGWRDGEDPFALVAEALPRTAEIAVEKDHLTLAVAEVITTRAGISELVDAGAAIRKMRLLKQGEEIEKLRRAARITDAVTRKLPEKVRPGQTEIDVALIIGSLIGEFDGTPAFPSLVQSGPNSALPHLEPSTRKLAEGDLVLLDFGAEYAGYKADTTRMVAIGDPNDDQERIHGIVLKAHDAAIEAVRPGATAGEVDSAARRVIDNAGYGPNFFHRVGHGLGMEEHEDPSMDPGSEAVLEPGMVFTIEPGIYIPGWGGIRLEDDVLVTESGHELLTLAERYLRPVY